MKRSLLSSGALVLAMVGVAGPAWAHPSTTPHVHPGEVVGLLVVSLLVVGMLALAGKKET
jgi:hypothetical protein